MRTNTQIPPPLQAKHTATPHCKKPASAWQRERPCFQTHEDVFNPNKHDLLPKKKKKVVRSDCENITPGTLWKIRAVPSQHVSRGVFAERDEPAHSFGLVSRRLNIENNYSNDDNEDLMTFTSRSSECGLLRVRASSNKWAV